MAIIIVALSIVLIAAATSRLNKFLPFKICPVCAGVAAVWLAILALINLGWLSPDPWLAIATLAMGGSAVGIAYQGPKDKNTKLPVIVAGFIADYIVLRHLNWLTWFAAAGALGIIGYFYFAKPWSKPLAAGDIKKIKQLEEKMKECC